MTKRHSKLVREPIQVYLGPDERRLLDQLATAAGISRAEVLRRGIKSFAALVRGNANPMLEFLDRAVEGEWPPDLVAGHDAHLADAYRRTPRHS